MINNVKYHQHLPKSILTLSLSMTLFMFLALLGSPIESALASANRKTIIQCLGQEEADLHHKRNDGPLYSLNQKLLNLFIVSSDLSLTQEAIRGICSPSSSFPRSLGLLRSLLLEGVNLFEVNEREHVTKTQKIQMIEVFLQEIPPLFFQYLADLQALLPVPNCLQEVIPEIKKLHLEYQYVEPEAEWNKNLLGPKRLRIIFDKIKNFDELFNYCQNKVRASRAKDAPTAKEKP